MENRQKILNYLQQHGRMTIREGLSLRINNPAEYVRRLRKQGFDIVTEWITLPNGKMYGVYIYKSTPIEKETTNNEITYH